MFGVQLKMIKSIESLAQTEVAHVFNFWFGLFGVLEEASFVIDFEEIGDLVQFVVDLMLKFDV